MNYTSQLLVEYESKLEAIQYRIEQFFPFDMPPRELVQEMERLFGIVSRLKQDLFYCGAV